MTNKRKKHIFPKIAAALSVICAALLLLGKYGLTVSRPVIASHRLPEAFDGFRIVQLTDLHGSRFGRGNERLITKVAGESPDIIALTGDFLDEGGAESELPELRSLIRALVKIAPVYFVSGNHDWASGALPELADILSDAGAVYLQNEFVTLERGGESIVLAGVEDPNGRADMPQPDELVDIIRDEHPGLFTVLLAHRNYWPDKYPSLPVDIILCGHAHGGIIRLPVLGGVIGTDLTLFPEHISGMSDEGAYTLVVSRGLGNSVSVPRIGNTPEIVSLELKHQS